MNNDSELARVQAMGLTTRERLLLAEQLWESVVGSGGIPPYRETIELAQTRDRELEDGSLTVISMEEMMARSYRGLS